jgi:uncharacterized protein YwgA
MKILSIGNSFSNDAQRYLSRLAKQEGVDMRTVNLYIGGCSLERHYVNMLEDAKAYSFEFNGESTGIKISIREALASNSWDFVTLQQASHFSWDFETYTPYIEALCQYVKKYRPHAKIVIHETWAYEDGSEMLARFQKFKTAKEMLDAVKNSYKKAAELISADLIIPSGEAMMKALQLGIEKIHRDTYHASLGAGRYLLALCWYKALTGNDITDNAFSDFDVPVTEEERKIVIEAVNAAF